MNPRSKIQEEAHFQILRHLHENPELSQRELGERVGISVGAVNYCLKALIDRGLVKARNFKRSANKIGYAYFLTPTGISEKTLLTARFLKRKIAEYEALRLEISDLEREVCAAAPTKSFNREETR
jgi:EPS-associated MarR family transcriptional regulator